MACSRPPTRVRALDQSLLIESLPPGGPLASWKRGAKADLHLHPSQRRHSPGSPFISPHTFTNSQWSGAPSPSCAQTITVPFCSVDTALTSSRDTLLSPMTGLCVGFMISLLDQTNLQKTSRVHCCQGNSPTDSHSSHSGPSQACPHTQSPTVHITPRASSHNSHLLQKEPTSAQGWAQGPPKAAGVRAKAVTRINHTKKGLFKTSQRLRVCFLFPNRDETRKKIFN